MSRRRNVAPDSERSGLIGEGRETAIMAADRRLECEGPGEFMPLRIYAPIEKGTEGGQKREHADDGMTGASKTLSFLRFLEF